MSIKGGPSIIKDGLIFCLDAGNSKSYPGTGTILTDLSSNNNNGTLVGGPTYTSEYKGGIVFDGASGKYINCGTDATLNTKRVITLSIWFKLTEINRTHSMLVKCTSNTASRQYCFFINSNNNAYFTSEDASGEQQFATASDTFAANTIYQWTGILDRSNQVVKQFVNGNLIYTNTGNIRATDMNDVAQPTTISQSTVPIKGNVYNAMIYNRVLTNNEVLQNYNAIKGRYYL